MSEQCLGASGTSLDAAKIRIVGTTGVTSETSSNRDNNNNSSSNNNNVNNNRDTSTNIVVGEGFQGTDIGTHKKLSENSGKSVVPVTSNTTTTLEFVSGDTSENYFTVASGASFDYRDYLFDNTNSDLLDSAGPTPPGSADGGLSSKNSSNAESVTNTNFDFDLSGDVSNRIPSLVTVGNCDPGSDIGSPPIDNATGQRLSLHQEHHQQQQQHSSNNTGQGPQQSQQQQQQSSNLMLFDTTMLDAGSCGVGGAGTVVRQQSQHGGATGGGGDVHDDSQQHSYVYNTPPPVLEPSITSVQVSALIPA